LVIDSLNRFTRARLRFFLFPSDYIFVFLKDITQIKISFSSDSLIVLNICLGFIMFGIALGIRPVDFLLIFRNPRGIGVGIISQFLLLPLLTFFIVYVFQPHPAFSLGLFLVAACPGGNVSNFITSVSGGHVALSVALTAFATVISPIMMPVNFEFWSSLIPETRAYFQSFELSLAGVFQTVLLLLILPLIAGITFQYVLPAAATRIVKPIKILSFLILLGFISIAIFNNFAVFKSYLPLVFLLVLLHNAMAFATGYFTGLFTRLSEADCRTVSIETGIQNSGLGLIIIFSFFGGNGGMAIIAAWWGVWHIIAGLALAQFFKSKDRRMDVKYTKRTRV